MEEGNMQNLEEQEDTSKDYIHKEDESDENLTTILSKWNLLHLKEFFKDENITINLLKRIKTDDLILITNKLKIGDALTFKYCLEEWRSENKLPSMDQNNKVLTINEVSSPKTSLSLNEVDISVSNIKTMDILKNHHNGQKILQNYQNTRTLTDEHRSVEINTIVQHFDFNNLPLSLQTSHRLENEILEIFPTEKLEFYRTERRGKIYTKFHNIRKQLKSLSETKSMKKNNEDAKAKFAPEENALISMQSLKYDNLSADEFMSSWSSCSKYRLDQIHNKSLNMSESLKAWPQYKGRFGFKLMDIDFSIIHKDADQILGWTDKFICLSNYMKQHLTIHDKESKEVLAGINPNNIQEDINGVGLKLLWSLHSYLFPTKKFQRKDCDGKKTYGRYSIRDSQESFIFISQTLQEQEDRLQFLKKRGEPIQPFILAIGNRKMFNIEKYYVYLDAQLLEVNTFCRALDICFKVFHIFNVEYPEACYPFWVFIEKFFYNIADGKKGFPKVLSLIHELSTVL
ncbi:uncharacterized protein LOC142242899 [Haematobia irritans]|uniref:uncharacterized protein LOC142242899 n=1 Tax=Haematobia irritans TaxID=7368 RepID=UPI003F5086C1